MKWHEREPWGPLLAVAVVLLIVGSLGWVIWEGVSVYTDVRRTCESAGLVMVRGGENAWLCVHE